jgi:hypothetical protein
MQRPFGAIVISVMLLILGAGCATTPEKPKLTEPEIQSIVMSLSDDLMYNTADACAQVIQRTNRADSREFCANVRLGTAISAVSAATSQNARVGVADLMTLAMLQRLTLESPEAFAALDEPDRLLLHDALATSEATIWSRAHEEVTGQQIEELRKLVLEWRAKHPDRLSVTQARLQEFDSLRQSRASNRDDNLSDSDSSILRLLRIDPMSGLDPATRQIYETRLFAERQAFWAQRLPMVLGWQMELTSARLLDSPSVTSVLQNSSTISSTARDFSETVKLIASAYQSMLALIPKERQAAIEQLNVDLGNNLQMTVDQMNRDLDSQRTQTLAEAEATSQRLVDHMAMRTFWVIAGAAAAIALIAFGYRLACARYPRR